MTLSITVLTDQWGPQPGAPVAEWDAYYTPEKRAALKEAFELVQDKTFWKNPVNATFDATVTNPELVAEAIMFYQGAEAMFQVVGDGKSVKVTSAGYLG
jgi:hypothetical protein